MTSRRNNNGFAGLKRIIFSSLILLFLSLSSSAQFVDTLRYSLQQKPRFFMTLASFNTFIDGQYANIGGVRMGLSYNQRIRFGFGLFSLANNDVVTPLNVQDPEGSYTTNGRLRMTFASFSTEYFFYNRYPWQFTVTPFNLGFGGAKYEYISGTSHILTATPSETIILYQPEISAQYNIFRWIGGGVSFGYRSALYRSRKQTQSLNAPTFAFDVRIFLDEVYKLLFEKEQENSPE